MPADPLLPVDQYWAALMSRDTATCSIPAFFHQGARDRGLLSFDEPSQRLLKPSGQGAGQHATRTPPTRANTSPADVGDPPIPAIRSDGERLDTFSRRMSKSNPTRDPAVVIDS